MYELLLQAARTFILLSRNALSHFEVWSVFPHDSRTEPSTILINIYIYISFADIRFDSCEIYRSHNPCEKQFFFFFVM
jgi:hypothetical protein